MEESLPFRISTITATGSVNTEINLDILYEYINIKTDEDNEGVLYVEYGKKKSDTVYKGFAKKFLVNKRKVNTTTKRFDNQVTIIYQMAFKESSTNLNIKVFKNGNIQITGIKYIDQGKIMIDTLITIINGIYATYNNVIKDINALCNKDYKIRLINSDFKIGFDIKREWFYKLFMSDFRHECSYEPCIYPGVKIQYFWNAYAKNKGGLCPCNNECVVGKGNGVGEGNCKKITIAVFQSGCVIITGAQTYEQISDAYKFISGILVKHRDEIEKVQVQTATVSDKEKKYIMLNKKNIIYPPSWSS